MAPSHWKWRRQSSVCRLRRKPETSFLFVSIFKNVTAERREAESASPYRVSLCGRGPGLPSVRGDKNNRTQGNIQEYYSEKYLDRSIADTTNFPSIKNRSPSRESSQRNQLDWRRNHSDQNILQSLSIQSIKSIKSQNQNFPRRIFAWHLSPT